MKKQTVIKIFVDVAMATLFLLLMYNYQSSPLFHEIAGISLGVFFVVHIALNWKQTVSMLRQLRTRKLSFLKALALILDILLTPLMLICVVSGLLIARELYVGIGGLAIDIVHTTSTNICFWLVIVHLIQHLKYVAAYAKQIAKSNSLPRTVGMGGVIVLIAGLLITNLAMGYTGTSDLNSVGIVQDQTIYDKRKATEVESISSSSSSSITQNTVSISGKISESTSDSSSTTNTPPTTCSLCNKNCLLSALQCNKGVQWAKSNGYEYSAKI